MLLYNTGIKHVCSKHNGSKAHYTIVYHRNHGTWVVLNCKADTVKMFPGLALQCTIYPAPHVTVRGSRCI